MSAEPLKAMGRWRATEGATEITVPLFATGFAWVVAYKFLSAPSTGRGVTWVELLVLLGACTALTGWMSGRQFFMAGRRRPWTLVMTAIIYAGVMLGAVSSMVGSAFETSCAAVGGAVVESMLLIGREIGDLTPQGPRVCKVGGVVDNPYLPGTLLRPTWDGSLHPLLWVVLGLIAPITALGTRDRRVFGTRIGDKLIEMLRYAPAKGAKSSLGGMTEAGVTACANATLWGELCGQLYAADRAPGPGEWCVRCHQLFRPCRRELRLKVVSLFGEEIDVLNGLERVDTLAWSHGEPIPPDARISGEERWVHLGDIVIPDVITVAQTLSLVHDKLKGWSGSETPRIAGAAKIATKRASRIAAWLWFGSLSHRLTYARPNQNAQLILSSTRLRDVVTEAGEELWLQLDIGFLPLEMRLGYRKELEGGRVMQENNKIDVWIPTSPPKAPKGAQGVWVPRVEGDALRLWLSTDRLRDGNTEGLSEPAPYYIYEAGAEVPPLKRPRPGSLDFSRYPLGGQGREPELEEWPGNSLAEWDWLEAPQLQLLRQQAVVLVEAKR